MHCCSEHDAVPCEQARWLWLLLCQPWQTQQENPSACCRCAAKADVPTSSSLTAVQEAHRTTNKTNYIQKTHLLVWACSRGSPRASTPAASAPHQQHSAAAAALLAAPPYSLLPSCPAQLVAAAAAAPVAPCEPRPTSTLRTQTHAAC